MNGGADTYVSTTAADIARHGAVDVGVTGFLVGFEQGGSAHDLTALAVTTLGHVMLDPGGLHGFADLVLTYGFDGGDFLANSGRDGRHARAYGLAVQMDGAGTAQSRTAAKLGAGQAQRIAQGPQHRRVGCDIDAGILAINS